MTQTYFMNLGSISLFFAKKTCLINYSLSLDKILRFLAHLKDELLV